MEEIILFILTFIFVLMIYEIFVVSKTKKRKAKGLDNGKEPIEIVYLIKRYKLDLKKINYNQLLQLIALVSSLDIAIVVSLIMIPNSFILAILMGLVGCVGSVIISYHLVYLFYKKKGMIK